MGEGSITHALHAKDCTCIHKGKLTAIHHQGLAISSSNINVRPLFHSNSYSFFTKACLLPTRKSAHLKVPTMWPSYVKVCHNYSKSLIFYPVGRHFDAHHFNLSRRRADLSLAQRQTVPLDNFLPVIWRTTATTAPKGFYLCIFRQQSITIFDKAMPSSSTDVEHLKVVKLHNPWLIFRANLILSGFSWNMSNILFSSGDVGEWPADEDGQRLIEYVPRNAVSCVWGNVTAANWG